MPISGQGWEIHFQRTAMQSLPTKPTKRRTVGTYQVFHAGVAQPGDLMSGMFAETVGPGDNTASGKEKRRIEAGRYPLATQGGTKYVTIGFADSNLTTKLPRPGIELLDTGVRTEILIHPASGFLWSIGCINLCKVLPDGAEMIHYTGSRARVIAVIGDLRAFLGTNFPNQNGRPIPDAFAVVDGEP
jgi:hypothetical protein